MLGFVHNSVYGKAVFCFLCLLALPPRPDAAPNVQFQRFPVVGDGVDNISAVRAIAQDHRGFIWLGGENGLARYDGREFVLYQTDPDDPHSLSGNYIWSMITDRDGVLWIGTWQGLNRYDPRTDRFERWLKDPADEHSISNSDILSLAVDHDNYLIVGTSDGLNILNPERTRVQRYYPTSEKSPTVGENMIQAVYVDSHNRIWLGSNNGLHRLDRDTGEFTVYLHDPAEPGSLIDNDVYAIAEDQLGRFWVGTQNRGLSRLDPEDNTFTHYRHDPDDATSLPSDQVAALLLDDRNNLWVALDRGGLSLYADESDSFHNFLHHPHDTNSIGSNHPRALFTDDQGDLWVGMFPGGFNYVDTSASVFTNFFHKPDDDNSLRDNGILRFFEDSDGLLWIGTEYGLNAFDRAANRFTRYAATPDEHRGPQFGAVLSITEDANGELWVGTWSGGLYRFNKQTGAFFNYFPDAADPHSINSEYIWGVLRDHNDTIWVATGTGGLNRYHPDTDSFSHYTVDPGNANSMISNRVWNAILDSRGDLWLGTLGGLTHFAVATETFTHYTHNPSDPTSISSNHVVSLHEDSRGWIWAGTRDAGLNILDREHNRFRTLTVREGLPSNSISSIIEDDQGNIWITAVNGIAHIDTATFTVAHYNEIHGLASQNYNRDATFRDDRGRLYVGGTNGFSVFDPAELASSSVAPPVAITDFRLFNRSVVPGDPDGLLDAAITETRELTLSYRHTMMSFDFAALSFRSPDRHQYAYMLEGFDQHWNEIGNNRTAVYTNIAPGRYVFRVRAANRDGVWNEDGAAIAITITPPWWRTWWAYLSYAVLFGALVYIANAYNTLRVRSEMYRTLSATDVLTGVSNRAAISEIARAPFLSTQIQRGMGLLVMDLDHFKEINDRLGHDIGDQILKEFATLVANRVRAGDRFARWGGEEFVLLSFAIGRRGLETLAEKLRTLVANHTFDQSHEPVRMTISIGVASAEPGDDFDKLFRRADQALYKAKAGGRNRVCIAEQSQRT